MARSEKVRGEYANGVGWEAGCIAPSTKYVDDAGNVTDTIPVGASHVLVAEGDVVRPHMAAVLAGSKTTRSGGKSKSREPLDDDTRA